MRKIFLFLSFSFSFYSYGQKKEKIIVYTRDPYDLYSTNDKDSANLFYEIFIPKNKPTAAIVILPGSGELVEDVIKQITLHTLAIQKNILVIFPSINWGTNKNIPEQQFLDTIFKQVVKRYNIPKDKFVLGGFSGGGMLALTYTEKANKYKDSTFVVPKAVFGIDPPLDFAHLWNHCKRDIERNFSEAAIQEAKWIMKSYTEEFGGSPEDFPENYIKYSIYSHSQKDGGNAKYLTQTPILLYTEPDIIWAMKNRHRDYYDMNCLDISAMINMLQMQGNKDAGLVVTNNKGRRLDGTRHPHSWSIMNSQQCLNWLLKQLNK